MWTGKHDENNPLPMVVQLKDEDTANAVLRAMFAAGCYNRQVHVKRGKYKKTGDKKTDKEKDDAIEKLKGCYGRPSTTKAERDAARKKKEYLASQVFQKKKTFQEFKQEREVKFANIRAKYTIDKTNGTKDLIKKPKISSKNNPGTGNEADENDEELIENFNPLTHNWYIGDYCRVVCDFDGLVHEAKIKKQYRYDPNVLKVLILGYGIREVKNVNIFEQSRGQKARIAQINNYEENNNKKVSTKKNSETKNKKAVLNFVDESGKGKEEGKDNETPPNSPKDDNKASKFFKISPAKSEEPSEVGDDDEKKNNEDKNLNKVEKTINSENDTTTVNFSLDESLAEAEMGQKLRRDDSKIDTEAKNSGVNSNLEESLVKAEKSELRDDDSEIEDIEAINSEVNDTINLPNDDTLDCNGFVTIVESNEGDKEDYKSLLKNGESPSLENFLSNHNLELSVNEESDNVSPPAPQEDFKILKEKEERVSRKDIGKKSGVLTRSQSTNRYNDRPPVGHDEVTKIKPLRES